MYIASYVNTPNSIIGRLHPQQTINTQKKLFTEDLLQDFFRQLAIPAEIAVRETVGAINPFAGEFVGDKFSDAMNYFVENVPKWHRESAYNRRYSGLDSGIQKFINDSISQLIIDVS